MSRRLPRLPRLRRLPRPRDGQHYGLVELAELTNHLVAMSRRYPRANLDWRPLKRALAPSVVRLYRRWGSGAQLPQALEEDA